MEGLYRCLCPNKMLSLICSMLWITSCAEGTDVSVPVGSTVPLHCNVSMSTQVKWSRNRVHLITYSQEFGLHFTEAAKSLKFNMSLYESDPYTLVIDRAQEFNTGNYTCEFATIAGVGKQTWSLTLTASGRLGAVEWGRLVFPVAIVVPCVCLLIFIISFALLRRLYSRQSEQTTPARTTAMVNTHCKKYSYSSTMSTTV
ncbi:uncharacterized protein LOC107989789 isoform X2 [Cynoglossus semilaevis]|uniref:uncharacterized protein LOC107989789 isoform X2 n=1 Tax=Cynoglossus semilaevis TaxID=244447 RepID=UPI000D628493|nr:uncharacterized protein LOC107989789 isoform X2 [Cynoglossus semilaevis]